MPFCKQKIFHRQHFANSFLRNHSLSCYNNMVCELLPFNCHKQNMLPKTDPKQTSSRSLNLKHIVLFKMEKFKVIKVNIYRLTYICLLVLVTLLGSVASKNFPPCNIFVTSDLKSTSLSCMIMLSIILLLLL